MKIIIEKHEYAPELNKVAYVDPKLARAARHLTRGRTNNGLRQFILEYGSELQWIPAPGITSIREFRQRNPQLKRRGLHVKLWTEYPKEKAWLQTQASGWAIDTAHVGMCIRVMREKLAPGGVAKAKIQLVG